MLQQKRARNMVNFSLFADLITSYDIIGTEIQLNVLIRDNLDIHRYYHLKKTQIPIQWSKQALSTLPEFVELFKTHRVEKSITVSSPREEVLDEQNKKRRRRSKKTLGSIKHRKTAYL
ncbi:hypothetical protein G9A89_004947 [Geosiphon pyriformis]|nr:hypothetical protein G9A89_004947 [Geosiphon pyriformis]